MISSGVTGRLVSMPLLPAHPATAKALIRASARMRKQGKKLWVVCVRNFPMGWIMNMVSEGRDWRERKAEFEQNIHEEARAFKVENRGPIPQHVFPGVAAIFHGNSLSSILIRSSQLV